MKNIYLISSDNGFSTTATVERETEKAILFCGDFIQGHATRGYATFWLPKSQMSEISVKVNEHSQEKIFTIEIPFWLKPQLRPCK